MGSVIRRALLHCCMVTLAFGCRDAGRAPPGAGPDARASAGTKPGAAPRTRAALIQSAELRRDSQAIVDDDLTSRDPALRRAAARALARIADTRAAELLTRVLADEDLEVAAWAAFGLGQTCEGREAPTIRRLVARSASLSVARNVAPAPRIKPEFAIADALARCGTALAEHGLRAQLEQTQEVAELAARALGKLASRHQKLEDASQVALLDAASRGERTLDYALFAFSRLPLLEDGVKQRLTQVAEQAIAAGGLRRSFAIRALGSAGPAAADPLSRVLLDAHVPAPERADAARQLARLGTSGQRALGAALERLLGPEDLNPGALMTERFGVLLTALASLQESRGAKAALERLSEQPIPEQAPRPLVRRLVELRCQAARLLAGGASLAKRLLACDPEPNGRTGALSVLAVLDRGELKAARRVRWQSFLKAVDPAVVQAALELIPKHAELDDVAPELTAALGSSEPGTVATAAQVLAKTPARGRKPDTNQPDPKLLTALGAALARAKTSDAVELVSALMDAAAALELLSAKTTIEAFCKSPRAALREHAEQALRRFGQRRQTCDTIQPEPLEVPVDVQGGERHFVLVTDAGELSLTLDPVLAPATSAEFTRLVAAGFYRGITLHRVVPGFVAQFGDPGGDGFGGSGKTLPSEASPLPFHAGSVGLALAGPDSGSSQLFVTLGTYPHLDGDYPLLGTADGSWDALARGDVISEIRIADAHR